MCKWSSGIPLIHFSVCEFFRLNARFVSFSRSFAMAKKTFKRIQKKWKGLIRSGKGWSKNKPTCKSAVSQTLYGSCTHRVMGSWHSAILARTVNSKHSAILPRTFWDSAILARRGNKQNVRHFRTCFDFEYSIELNCENCRELADHPSCVNSHLACQTNQRVQ